MTMTVAWTKVSSREIRQGDWLEGFPLPVYDYAELMHSMLTGEEVDITVVRADLLVLTHSCDLEQNKAPLVTLCPMSSKSDFLAKNPELSSKSDWGNIEGLRKKDLHVIPSPLDITDQEGVVVVHFRHLHTVPIEAVLEHASLHQERWRLASPFLEKCSERFGDMFSTVAVPDYSWKTSKASAEIPAPTKF